MNRAFLYFLYANMILCFCARAQSSGELAAITRVKAKWPAAATNSERIYASFAIADEYMEFEQYDSAQYWLLKIYELQQQNAINLQNYLVFTRQSEVYYYNNLLELGLQNAFQSLSIAEQLNDSLLLADAHNFIGLFYVSLGNAPASVKYLKRAVQYSKESPYPPRYLSITQPHHIYSNLSEAYEKNGQPDSALMFIRLSLIDAKRTQSTRATILAYNNIAKLLLKNGQIREAETYYSISLQEAGRHYKRDIELLGYLGLARCAQMRSQAYRSVLCLNQGLAYIVRDSTNRINAKFKKDFLKGAIEIFQALGKERELLQSYRLLNNVEQKENSRMNDQAEFIIQNSFSLQSKLLQLQLQKQVQVNKLAKTRLYLLILLFAIALITGAAVVYVFLRNKRMKYAQQQAVSDERERIIADLHDDVGGGLSSIRIISELLSNPSNELNNTHEYARKILGTVKDVSQKMNTLYWALNTDNDTLQSFCEYLKQYASGFFCDTGLHFSFSADACEDVSLNGNLRKNIFLLVKEILNNALKHSGATNVTIVIGYRVKELTIRVADNGGGILQTRPMGNGLKNMEKRARDINALLTCTTSGSGTNFLIQLQTS